jgi:hypothetical protein
MNVSARSHIIPGIPFCVPVDVPRHLYAFWIPIIAFESLLCGMALYRGFQGIVGDGSLFRSGRRLVTILVRDSILFFLVYVPFHRSSEINGVNLVYPLVSSLHIAQIF